MLYVTKKKYPPQSGDHFKRIIRKAHTQYKVEGSKLYIMGDKHCIEVPAKFDERLKLLKSTHKDELGLYVILYNVNSDVALANLRLKFGPIPNTQNVYFVP